MRLRRNPTIYEINTAVFLGMLSREHGRTITFASVPSKVWDQLASLPIDAVWFMGVWQRSPLARVLADENPELKRALPDLKPADVLGSAYSIYDYTVDEHFGGDLGLAKARAELGKRGIGLILDYVPNHVALDHPWTTQHADYFITGSKHELTRYPGSFAERPVGIVAKGKDPNYAPWSDVAQLNAFSPALRTAITGLLTKISDQCDGVRCDMAMLMTNAAFAKTWGRRAGRPPGDDYWPSIIPTVKRHNPDFRFIAEVYWDMELTLLEQGFDFCYDKTLYDHLRRGSARGVRRHLTSTHDHRSQLLYFIENHDEPRAAAALPNAKEKAAAVIIASLPGARLYHDGQFEGYRVRVPVHLARRPVEPADSALQRFYAELLLTTESIHIGDDWQLHPVTTLRTRRYSKQLLAWSWMIPSKGQRILVIVNYSSRPAAGRLYLARRLYRNVRPRLLLVSDNQKTDVSRLLTRRTVSLDAWQYAIIKLSPRPPIIK